MMKNLLEICIMAALLHTSIATAKEFNPVNKKGLVKAFPRKQFKSEFSTKLLQSISTRFEEHGTLIKERFASCYQTVRDCDAEVDALSHSFKNNDIPLLEQFDQIEDLLRLCDKSPKSLNTKCASPIVDEIVDSWITNALTNQIPSTTGGITFEIYAEFRKRFYDYFSDTQNYQILHEIFKGAKEDLIDFLSSVNTNKDPKKAIEVVRKIRLEAVFILNDVIPKHPFAASLTAGIPHNSIEFGPSLFFTGDMTQELAYFFLVHEMGHYFDMCTSKEGPYHKALTSFDDYLISGAPYVLKNEYRTQNRISPEATENFQKWICNDQLVELVPDWIANHVFRKNFKKYGFGTGALICSMAAFFNQPAPEGYEELEYKQHIPSHERLRMTKQIILEGLNY